MLLFIYFFKSVLIINDAVIIELDTGMVRISVRILANSPQQSVPLDHTPGQHVSKVVCLHAR